MWKVTPEENPKKAERYGLLYKIKSHSGTIISLTKKVISINRYL